MRADIVYAGDLHEPMDLLPAIGQERAEPFMDSPYLRLHAFDERTDGLQLEPVMLGEEPLDGLEQLIFLALEPAPGAPEDSLQRDLFAGDEKIHQVPSRNPEQVRGDGVYLDVGAFEKLVNPALVIGKALHEGLPQPGKVAPLSNMPLRYETAFEQAMAQKAGKPPAVRHIGLPARQVFHMSGVHEDHLAAVLQHIVHRPPVYARALHRHHMTPMLKNPVFQPVQVFGKGPELVDALFDHPVFMGRYQRR
ncbi:MAG: hypothetical protein BWX71_02090 [Deltaproteobacteria bacterium ADurb.Bin072]|nr:MAG: hypothetical protein BWX71_02090 [Deltaproteobacteria bacterium ADurb.Bin072]